MIKRRLVAVLCGWVSAAAPAATVSDLRDYALAACLIKQSASPALREEGYHLADIVLNRTGISPFAWRPLQNAVEAALARQPLLMVHVDAPVAQSTRPAPLATCLLVIDTPAVRRAMTGLATARKR